MRVSHGLLFRMLVLIMQDGASCIQVHRSMLKEADNMLVLPTAPLLGACCSDYCIYLPVLCMRLTESLNYSHNKPKQLLPNYSPFNVIVDLAERRLGHSPVNCSD